MAMHPDSGRYDNLHGDEDFLPAPDRNEYTSIMMQRIADGDRDAIERFMKMDAATEVIVEIAKRYYKPEYQDLIDTMEADVETWYDEDKYAIA